MSHTTLLTLLDEHCLLCQYCLRCFTITGHSRAARSSLGLVGSSEATTVAASSIFLTHFDVSSERVPFLCPFFTLQFANNKRCLCCRTPCCHQLIGHQRPTLSAYLLCVQLSFHTFATLRPFYACPCCCCCFCCYICFLAVCLCCSCIRTLLLLYFAFVAAVGFWFCCRCCCNCCCCCSCCTFCRCCCSLHLFLLQQFVTFLMLYEQQLSSLSAVNFLAFTLKLALFPSLYLSLSSSRSQACYYVFPYRNWTILCSLAFAYFVSSLYFY